MEVLRVSIIVLYCLVLVAAQNNTTTPATPTPTPATGGCFPGDALVQTIDGKWKEISQINLGDQVAVGYGSQGVIYSEVYAFGHKNPEAVSEFIHVSIGSFGTLELTQGHFVPVKSEEKMLLKRAGELKVGDILWNVYGTNSSPLITGISLVTKKGLFNPYTLAGSIIVNNVEASVHSEWLLDSVFDSIGKAHWLPKVYQNLLAPARLMYRTVNKELYIKGYNMVDACFSLSVGAKDIALAAAVGGMALSA